MPVEMRCTKIMTTNYENTRCSYEILIEEYVLGFRGWT